MNIESVFIWEDARVNLPPTNNHASDYTLFTFLDELHCGYLDYSGYFRSINTLSATAIALAPFEPTEETFCSNWKYNLENEDLPTVSRWIYLKDTYPKLDVLKDKLIRLYETYLYSEDSFSKSILNRSIEYSSELYNEDKLNFIIPSLTCNKGTLELKWSGKNGRSVYILISDENDRLICDSPKFNQTFFPFTVYKLINWLTWLNK